MTEVWTPRLTIIGQQHVWPAFREAVEIQPNGDVVYRQKSWGHFSQPLALRDFPMDQQNLTIVEAQRDPTRFGFARSGHKIEYRSAHLPTGHEFAQVLVK